MNKKNQIRFILEGDTKGLQKLADLQTEGKLERLLNELKPDDMSEIKVIKAEFIDDEETIKKCNLISAIKEGKADKNNNKANLSGANLRGVNLAEFDLSNADLSNADLRYVNFNQANLNDANLSGSDLSFSNLTDASCCNTDFTNTDLTGVTPFCY